MIDWSRLPCGVQIMGGDVHLVMEINIIIVFLFRGWSSKLVRPVCQRHLLASGPPAWVVPHGCTCSARREGLLSSLRVHCPRCRGHQDGFPLQAGRSVWHDQVRGHFVAGVVVPGI